MKNRANLAPILEVEREDSSFVPPQTTTKSRRHIKLCPQHRKTCELFCLHDHIPVCTDCAIFGEHKTHDFKTMCEFDRDKVKTVDELQKLMEVCNGVGKKIDSSQHENDLMKEVQLLRESVKKNFGLLREYIELVQKKALEEITVSLEKVLQKIVKTHQLPDFLTKKVEDWQIEALNQTGFLQNQVELSQQGKYIYTIGPSMLDQGHKLMKLVEKHRSDIHKELTTFSQSIKVTFDYEVVDKFQKFAQVFVVNSENLEESLLDGISLENNSSDEKEKQDLPHFDCQSIKVIEEVRSESDFSELCESEPKDIQSNDSNNSSFMSIKTVNIGCIKLPSKKPIKKSNTLKLPERYQIIHQAIKKDQLEIVDLTNAELGDDTILKISESISKSKAKTVKFIRNKLSDEIIPKILPNLSNVIILNLSQNYLTEKTLDTLLVHIAYLPKLRSVILSQNKIKERSVKDKLKLFANKNIVVSL